MTENEKNEWYKAIRISHNINCLKLADRMRNKQLYDCILEELTRDGYKISLKEVYALGGIKNLLRKLLGK